MTTQQSMTATYSPEDNKLRLYSLTRLDTETYQRIKAAGFKWAPKQDLFVACMWTPDREDLLLELCGEIGDEDTVEDNWGNGGENFTRTVPFDNLKAIMTRAQVDAAKAEGRLSEVSDKTGFLITSEPNRKETAGHSA